MAIIGRKKEINALNDILNKKTAQFVVVYGRRRVGKTYLINEFFSNRFSFKATAARDNKKTRRLKETELKVFQRALEKYGAPHQKAPADWFEAFDRLASLLDSPSVYRENVSGKRIVFIDEIPWFDTPKSDFRIAFDLFWNEYGSTQNDLVLVVCGSAASWIIENILENKAGMHNRSTNRIHITPMCLKEAEELIRYNGIDIPRRQIIEYYMAFGGVPYYLNMLSPRYSVAQNIEHLCFEESGQLSHELEELFASLFVHHETHLSVIKALSTKRMGLTRNQIIQATSLKSGNKLTTILKELERCSFIRKYENAGDEIYQLVDLFTMFALNYMDKDQRMLWTRYASTSAYQSWCGYAFEIVCLNNIESIKSALGISGVEARCYSYYCKGPGGAQIDLLIDRSDDVMNVCEMKYTLEPFVIDKDYEAALIHKMERFRDESKTKKALILTMISAEGIKKNMYSGVIAVSLTSDDLFLG